MESPGDLLDPDEILKQEFAYARETALQANNDRTLVVNLYLLLVGGLGSVLLGVPALAATQGVAVPPAALAAILFLIGLLGLFSVLKLIRLRQAWHDSVLAMSRIKDFYLAQFPSLAPAFRWRTETIPAPSKIGTITFDLVALVTIIDSGAVSGAALLLVRSGEAALLAGTGFAALQATLYFRLLRTKPRSAADGMQ